MNKIVHTLILSLLALVASAGFLQAQDKGQDENYPADSSALFTSQIGLMAKSFGDSVVLRWAPNKPGAWSWANKVGYIIERVAFKADSTFDAADFQRISKEPIKPWPLDDWQKIIDPANPSPYAAIAAQSLYGKSFKTGGIFEQADDFNNRFSFSLLAADISPQTATALGLRWVDTNISATEHYIYRVFLAEPSNYYQIDTAYVVVNAGSIEKIPEIIVSEVQENELRVNFLWDRKTYDAAFSAYYIEKSVDGKKFTRLNEHPYINPISSEFKSNQNTIFYSDSLNENYKPYYYRIIGISPFGELSEGSNVIKAMGRDRTPPSPPENVTATHLGGSRVSITWEKQHKESDLGGYLIGRSQEAGKGFQPLFTDPLSTGTTSYIDEHALENGTNYYLVAAIDTAGNGSSSLVSYAMIVDSLPPSPPQNLIGEIDSTGNVILSWDLGPEMDIAGYMVYFSNAKNHVFTTLNKKPLPDTTYQDSIQILTLTEEIFYVIKAVDVTYNYSESSDTLRLIRPDLIPPTAPIFSDYEISKEGVFLSWLPSSSEDVLKYALLRKDSAEFHLLQEIQSGPVDYSYLDSTAIPGIIYSYALYAIDDADLKSALTQPLTIKMPDFSRKTPVSNISLTADTENKTIKISWQYHDTGDYRFVMYKAIDGGAFKSYKSLTAEANMFTDYDIKEGKVYEYVLKVHFKDGKTSSFGKIVKGSI